MWGLRLCYPILAGTMRVKEQRVFGTFGARFCGVALFCSLAAPVSAQPLAPAEDPEKKSSEIRGSSALPWPDKLEPIEYRSPEEGAVLRFNLASQTLFRFDHVEGGNGERRDEYDIDFRRIRIAVQGAFFKDRLRTRLQVNAGVEAGESVELLDAWLEAKIMPYMLLRAGQFITPFTYFRTLSFRIQQLPDWPITTRFFGAERQIGVMLHDGRPTDEDESDNPLSYAIGVFTGQNARASHNVGITEVYGDTPANPSSFRDYQLPDELHPEVFVRLAHHTRDLYDPRQSMDLESLSDVKKGKVRHTLALSAAVDAGPRETLDTSMRLAPEFVLKARGWTLIAIAYLAWYDPVRALSTRLAFYGSMTELAWRANRWWGLAARYAFVGYSRSVRNDARFYAQERLATAEDESTRAELGQQYAEAGLTRAQHEASLGLNVYLIEDNLKLQTDISSLHTYRSDADRNDWRVRTQLQVAF